MPLFRAWKPSFLSGLYLLRLRMVERPLPMEFDQDVAGPDGTDCPSRNHDLKFLGLLMGGAVQLRGGEQAHIVRPGHVLHEVVDEPLRRQAAGDPVLGVYDHVEAGPGHDKPTSLRQAVQGHVGRGRRCPKAAGRFLAGKGVAALP